MELGKTFEPIQIPPEGMKKSPWAYSANPGKIDVNKIANLEVDTITVSEDGYIRSGKTSFTDDTRGGYYISTEGVYVGSVDDATKLKYDIDEGTFDFVGTISSKSTADIAAAFGIGDDAQNIITNIINARKYTTSKKIIYEFKF